MLRTIHICLSVAGFFYVYVAEKLAKPRPAPSSSLYWTVVIVATAEVMVVLFARRRWVMASEAAILARPQDRQVLRRWLRGYLLGWTLSLSIVLYGLVLRIMGVPVSRVDLFYVVGVVSLVLNAPRRPSPET